MLLLAGCASAPLPPTASLTEARDAIQAAERDDASRYATAELDEARQKLLQADKAVVSEDMKLAEQLAQESTVAAQLASARTEATKAKGVNDEISRGTKALVEEMQRTGDQQ
jgi:small-conductance mechanosensitive channel